MIHQDSVDENRNRSAFPSADGSHLTYRMGLTKREYFAGLAMQNLQNVLLRESGEQLLGGLLAKHGVSRVATAIALEAVAQADALIEVLTRE